MRAPLLWILVALSVATTGCFSRPSYQKVFQKDKTTVRLRHFTKGFSTVEKGFEHPFNISSVRAAHILSRIDIRRKSGSGAKRVPAIPTELVYTLGDGLSKAFKEAGPNDEVVVQAIVRSRRFKIFDRQHLTTLVTYRKDDLLYIHLGVNDWEITPRREDSLPEPEVGQISRSFSVLSDDAMLVVDPNSVAVSWRDPIFAKPTRTRLTASGRVVRRTVLMESAPEESPDEAPEPLAPVPANLSPEALRELADLEDARRRGELTESEYALERRRILAGDAGSQ